MDFKTEEEKIMLFSRCIAGKAISSEYNKVYDLLQQNKEDKELYNTLYSTWLATGLDRDIENGTEERVWSNIVENKDYANNKYRHLKTAGKVAAIALVLVSFGLNISKLFRTDEVTEKLMAVEAPKGAKSMVTLLDGTRVILNSGSKIEYSDNYNKNTRDVFLSGEAYFEVAKNKSLPFKVHAGNLIIKALGTVFNVKAYPEEKRIETTLVEGLVSIENVKESDSHTPVYLKPNQQAVYFKTKAEIEIGSAEKVRMAADSVTKIEPKTPGTILNQTVVADFYTSWKDKQLVFSGESFGDFTLRLERLYDTKIVIADPEISQYKISGSIEQENLEMVLKALQLIVPIDYKFGNKQVTIYANRKLKKSFDEALTK